MTDVLAGLDTPSQERRLVTEVPGPAVAGADRPPGAAVSSAVGSDAAGLRRAGRRRRRCVDVDGNSLIDLGSGIAVVSVGNAAPRGGRRACRQQVGRVHAHLLHGHALRGLRRGLRGARAAHPGRPREAVGAVQLRRRGGGERGQGRAARHRPAGGRRLRPRLPRPDQPHDGADREEHALQARLRAVRRRGLPRADVLPVPRPAGHDRRRGRRPGASSWSRPRSARPTSPPCSSSRSRARAASSSRRRGLPARHRRLVPARRARCSSPTRSRPASAGPATGSPARHEGVVPDLVTTAKGIAGGLPLAARDRPRRAHGRRAHRRPRRHLRRQPGRLRRRARRRSSTMREQDLAGAARAIEATMLPRLRALQERHRRDRRRARPRRDARASSSSGPAPPSPTPALTGPVARACHAQGVVVLTAARSATCCASCPRW